MNARPELSFDGCGINGPDEFRTRVATFRSEAEAKKYGPLFAAAPRLVALLKEAEELMPLGTTKRADWVMRAGSIIAEAEPK